VAAPHCEFSVICVAHSVLLLPRLAFDSFLLVTDPRLTGHRTVAYRPPVLLARTVVYLLHYAFLAARPLLLFAASSSFRRHVAELCVRCRCCLCCCCCRGRHKRRQTRRSSSSDGSVGGACSATSHAGTAAGGGERAADNVQPLLGGKTETSTPHTNHVTFDPNTVDLCATRGAATSASAAIVLENDEGVRPRNTENFNQCPSYRCVVCTIFTKLSGIVGTFVLDHVLKLMEVRLRGCRRRRSCWRTARRVSRSSA